MSSSTETPSQLVTVDADQAAQVIVLRHLAQPSALIRGHFALHRGRHSTTALRFRDIGRDPEFMRTVIDALVAHAPDELARAFAGAKVLTPESSGLFLGRALAARYGTPHVVAQTDLRRRPTKTLLSGAIQPNDRVVLVNDVGSTGASLDPLRELVAERGGLAVGVVLFAVVGGDGIEKYCATWHLPSRWLVTARWDTYAPERCPGCRAGEPLTPVAEFV
jgi:orotate phosphoribosyltransferase